MKQRKRLDETIGSVKFDSLRDSSLTSVYTIKLAAGQGVLKRGTVLVGNASCMEAISAETTGKAVAVLSKEVDTGTGTGTVTGTAYRTGRFNADGLTGADGYEITEADKESLRKMGVIISKAVRPAVGVLYNATLGAARLGAMKLGG